MPEVVSGYDQNGPNEDGFHFLMRAIGKRHNLIRMRPDAGPNEVTLLFNGEELPFFATLKELCEHAEGKLDAQATQILRDKVDGVIEKLQDISSRIDGFKIEILAMLSEK
jgi:hypothetical protein